MIPVVALEKEVELRGPPGPLFKYLRSLAKNGIVVELPDGKQFVGTSLYYAVKDAEIELRVGSKRFKIPNQNLSLKVKLMPVVVVKLVRAGWEILKLTVPHIPFRYYQDTKHNKVMIRL